MADLFMIVDKVEQGYTKQPNAILRDSDLTDSAKLVLFFLLSITKGFNPTIKKISKTLHMSEKKVQRALALLKSTGYITITRIKNGSLYGGMQWQISNFHGHFSDNEGQEPTDKIDHIYTDKNDIVENVHTCTDKNDYIYTDKNDNDNDVHTCTDKNDNVDYDHTYEQPIGLQPTDEQPRVNNQMSEEHLLQPPAQAQEVAEEESLAPNKTSSWDNSSGEQVISRKEYQFQQFLKKYPKAPLNRDMEDTRKAFFEVCDLDSKFAEVMAGLDTWCCSAEWRKDNGRWIKKPLNWLKERQWEKVNVSETLSDAYMDHLNELFPTGED